MSYKGTVTVYRCSVHALILHWNKFAAEDKSYKFRSELKITVNQVELKLEIMLRARMGISGDIVDLVHGSSTLLGVILVTSTMHMDMDLHCKAERTTPTGCPPALNNRLLNGPDGSAA